MRFIKAQLEAGADGIQIVEPNCSLISPKFYEANIMPLHKQMVDLIQRKKNGFARLHVCGDTSALMPYTLGTGTHILDVDSAVDLTKVAHLLGPQQCFCGNLNTSEELLFGKPEASPLQSKSATTRRTTGSSSLAAATYLRILPLRICTRSTTRS